ncbi:GNAT family N-acetyltransferase [Agrobacterium rosae]|uniref:GNAT family N-acetyltransferase n=1 Tax=Agrobacterium rosae TaxID=1972867 RepID=A0AAE5RZ80_9HYPH|nr:GNAT family N-acetyltransferase [Agrobacterium rosae]KAA3512189.1 GNAT family N-acetyltransferase [Agrobacterium rosae]KAA3520361.1 GNAT family N-acetyltransferase [Agrobacterium rosae]MDX8327614.1 GNAT family N-acetyltransferase [Agrobacterium rosae]MQB48799.1 GNAT family N-acetyltransferase [Agrobacterium rosae]POO52386.1 GNAT family N-acetyltransferase [Agrobacterium rosae]
MSVEIKLEHPRQPEIQRLMEMSNAYMASLYPAESNHMVDLDALEKPNASFFVARNEGTIVGCCALVEAGDGTAEIKRMFVDPEARGLSIGKLMMQAVIARGQGLGLSAIRLETGISQPEAIGLYRKAGFVEIEPFPPYKPDPLSMFMELTL